MIMDEREDCAILLAVYLYEFEFQSIKLLFYVFHKIPFTDRLVYSIIYFSNKYLLKHKGYSSQIYNLNSFFPQVTKGETLS